MATVADFLQRHSELSPASDTALLDTELLLCHCLSVNRTWLKTWPDKKVLFIFGEKLMNILSGVFNVSRRAF